VKQLCRAGSRGYKKGFLAEAQETSQRGYEEAFVDVTGIRAYYLHAGSGKPMLLIHGLVGSSANGMPGDFCTRVNVTNSLR
jgi:hypothetical protein